MRRMMIGLVLVACPGIFAGEASDGKIESSGPASSAEPVVPPPHSLAPTALVFVAAPGREDCLPATPGADGSYTVAVAGDGKACIGMQWADGLYLRRVGLTLAEGTALGAEALKLHVQDKDGKWRELPDPPVTDGRIYLWSLPPNNPGDSLKAVKWILSTGQPVVIRSLHACEESIPSLTSELLVQSVSRERTTIPVESCHGLLLDERGRETGRCAWDTGSSLRINVLYTPPMASKAMRTLLRFGHPAGGFSVAVEDVVAKDCVYVPHAGVFITTAAKPVAMKEHVAAVAGRKTVLEQVRQMPDQTLDQAMSKTHIPVQDQGPMMLSLACDNGKFIVNANGTISGKHVLFEKLVPAFGNDKAIFQDRHLEGGWRPIPVSVFKGQNGLVYGQRTCVAPMDDEAPAETAPWVRARAVCVAEWTVENTGQAEAEVRLMLAFPAPKDGTNKTNTLQRVKEGAIISIGEEDLVAFVEPSDAGPLTAAVDGSAVVLTGRLAAGKTARGYAYLPARKTAAKDYAALSGGSKWFDRTVAYWDKVMSPAMQIDLPDAFLVNVIRASQAHCMLAARDEDGGRRVDAWIAPTMYGALDTEAQAIIRGMDMVGQQEFARRALERFLSSYSPEGQMFKSYSVAGTGQNLWTSAEHYERTGDRRWLEKWAPTFARGCQWIGQQRRRSRITDNLGRHAPEWGLTPPGTSADWRLVAYRFYNGNCSGSLPQAGGYLRAVGGISASGLWARLTRC